MADQRQICEVVLYYGSYKGTETVYCDSNDDNDYIIAKAWRQARADFLSMAATSAKIISREDYFGE